MSYEAVAPEPSPPDAAVILHAVGGVVLLAVIAAALAGGVAVALPLAGATLVAGVQVFALTIPALLVVQAALDLEIAPARVRAAVAEGAREGASILLALAPVTLFLGMCSPGIHLATAAYFACMATGGLVGVAVTARHLVDGEPRRGRALAVAWGWAFGAALIAVPAVTLAFHDLLAAAMGTILGGGR